ncbi:uncharacterized protein EAE97_004595 [Botrytis byssoidea]|uniref:2EXR domain-containing protein n=1 Tax=Botrytis byssoidea TaxID=139641 RepID=A0A9P5IMZ9_9HELO|nr:uncharacterized protein EAE97_004595 [Botrytis byssoidea]KAF7947346.1 hypothetical protein EAE97_004595 [Botrytis byssoidea]
MLSSRSGPKSFTKFPELPLELQRLVWKFASFERRHIPVAAKGCHSLSKQVTGEDGTKQLVRFRSDTPIPTLFSVCRDSRLEAKRYYKRALVAEHNFRFFSISLVPRFYINPHCDVICPAGDFFGDITVMLVAAMHKVQCQSIALDEPQWGGLFTEINGPAYFDQWLTSIVRPPHALKSITLYSGAKYETPYTDGSRGFPHTISSVDWDIIQKTDQCALGVAVTDLHRSIMRYRDLIPKMVKDRHDVEKGLMDPPTHPLLARLPVFHHLETQVLELWTPPRLSLLMYAIPNSLSGIMYSKDPFEVWDCGVGGCQNCTWMESVE